MTRLPLSVTVLTLAMLVAACQPTGMEPPAAFPGPPLPTGAETGPSVTVPELEARRSALMEALPDALVLLPAEPSAKTMEQPGWIQHPSFFYFTGLLEGTNAVLLVDAPRSESVLFVGPVPSAFGAPASDVALPADASLAGRTGVDRVLPWDEFVPYVTQRLTAGATLHLDAARRPVPSGSPPGMPPLTDAANIWRHAVETAFPGAEIHSAADAIAALRWKKSPHEQEQIRRNAIYSARALMAGMRAVRAGLPERHAEAAVVAACLEAGANGPSFWPWMQSGPNAHFGRLANSFHVYDNLNRTMQAGELLRADVGCMAGGYGGDVGRTVPVSGRFEGEQAFIWDRLVEAYHTGIHAMADGVPLDAVRAASTGYLEEVITSGRFTTPTEGDILRAMASDINWHIHSIGVESAEPNTDVLVDGTVIAYEPMFVWGDHAYYLEDMILVTGARADVLTAHVPATAAEMAAFLNP